MTRAFPPQESSSHLRTSSCSPPKKTEQMNFPDRALTPSRNDSEYDNSNTQATDRVPETWGSNTPWQYDVPFQTALTPEPAPRFRYSLPSPPPSPFAPLVPTFAYSHYEPTHAVFPNGNEPQDSRYFAINNRLDATAPPTGSYYDPGLARMDGQLSASLSRRRPGDVNQPLEAQGMQDLSLCVDPNPPKREGPSGYSSGDFPSGEAAVADSEVFQNLGNDSSSGNRNRRAKDQKRRQHRAH
jgi:hypothetical protein